MLKNHMLHAAFLTTLFSYNLYLNTTKFIGKQIFVKLEKSAGIYFANPQHEDGV